MMDDTNQFFPSETVPETEPSTPAAEPAAAPATDAAVVSPAVEKFKSCRWRATPEDGEFCTHRDVLPFAGKEGFVAESWCPECAFYKLRRTPKKRDKMDYMY
jgi:predicted secreted protein